MPKGRHGRAGALPRPAGVALLILAVLCAPVGRAPAGEQEPPRRRSARQRPGRERPPRAGDTRPAPDRATTRPHSPPRRRGPGAPPWLSDEQRAKVMAFANEHLPEQHERLKWLVSRNPALAAPLLSRLHRLYVNVRRFPPEVRQTAIDGYRSNWLIYGAVRELRRTEDPAEKEELTGKLRELLARQFDCDQTVREYEVKRLAEQVSEITAEIARRRENRQEIIARQLERLLKPPPARPVPKPPAPATRAKGPGPARGGPPLGHGFLTPRETAEVMAFAREHMPDLHDRLRELKRGDPTRGRWLLRRVHRLVDRMRRFPPAVREAAIARHKVNVRILETVREIRQSADAKHTEALTGRLRELLARQFERDQVVKEHQAKRLRQQLDDLQAGILRQRRDRDKILSERVQRLCAVGAARPRPPRSPPPP